MRSQHGNESNFSNFDDASDQKSRAGKKGAASVPARGLVGVLDPDVERLGDEGPQVQRARQLACGVHVFLFLHAIRRLVSKRIEKGLRIPRATKVCITYYDLRHDRGVGCRGEPRSIQPRTSLSKFGGDPIHGDDR